MQWPCKGVWDAARPARPEESTRTPHASKHGTVGVARPNMHQHRRDRATAWPPALASARLKGRAACPHASVARWCLEQR
eukprot:3432811-Alexandrium_andersonii.AAC.1